MNKKIGFVVSSTLFLIVVLSTSLAFAQPWTSVDINVQTEDYVISETEISFWIIEALGSTPNDIKAAGDIYIKVVPGDRVVVTGYVTTFIEYSETSGHLVFLGTADSITVNAVEIPELSSFLILSLLMIATLLAAIVLKRKRTS